MFLFAKSGDCILSCIATQSSASHVYIPDVADKLFNLQKLKQLVRVRLQSLGTIARVSTSFQSNQTRQ